jgi:hypothetical protein
MIKSSSKIIFFHSNISIEKEREREKSHKNVSLLSKSSLEKSSAFVLLALAMMM